MFCNKNNVCSPAELSRSQEVYTSNQLPLTTDISYINHSSFKC